MNIVTEILFIIIILFPAFVIHEYAHAWTANKLGDPTAKNAGRLTLNPLKHIDPFGSIVLPAILIVLRALGSPLLPIAFAKPVPVNFLRLSNPKRDMILVGLAGPAINIIIAVGFSFLYRLSLPSIGKELITFIIIINLLLAIFNMIPIPPLDGSRLVMGLLPNSLLLQYSRLEKYGILIVFLLLPLGLFEKIVWPIVKMSGQLLGVQF